MAAKAPRLRRYRVDWWPVFGPKFIRTLTLRAKNKQEAAKAIATLNSVKKMAVTCLK